MAEPAEPDRRKESPEGTPKPEKSKARPSAGTPDVERGKESPGNRGSQGSLVNDSVGAYKERP
jgi:hypothetical protein